MTVTARHMALRPSAEPGAWINDPSRSCNGLDTDAFFPEYGGKSPRDVARALRICSHCPVLAECRQYALNAEPRVWGIWGGTTDGQRARIRRQARAA